MALRVPELDEALVSSFDLLSLLIGLPFGAFAHAIIAKTFFVVICRAWFTMGPQSINFDREKRP
jgi:hypothetical protein